MAKSVEELQVYQKALDAANAELRRRLIQLHIEVENACDTVLDRRILELYREIAAGRELQLPAPT